MKNLVVLSVVCLFSSTAFSKPAYLAKFKAAYPAAKALQNCQTCHGATYAERNDFGKDYAANNHDFAAIEGFDSDVDGVTNLAEITAGTLPGSADSKPVVE
jgi:hypothetical protein